LLKYLIQIKIPFEALDDVEARKAAKEILKQPFEHMSKETSEIKFQHLPEGSQPRKIVL